MSRDAVMARIEAIPEECLPSPSHRYHPLNPRVLDSIHCVCGAIIAGYVVDERHTISRQVNGQTVVHERMVFMQYPLWAEALIEFDDGTAHHTHGCKGCVARDKTPEELERWYCRDLMQFDHEERNGLAGAPVPWEIFAHRKPVSMRPL